MRTSPVETDTPTAEDVQVTEDTLHVTLSDGRTISAPVAWYPRLMHGTARERHRWRLIGKGRGIHWTDLDEDISVENLLAGRASGESLASFRQWLASRPHPRPSAFRRRRGVVRRA